MNSNNSRAGRARGRAVLDVLATTGIIVLLSACGGSPEPAETAPVVTTEQARLDGEWVLTRTVTASDDLSNPEHLLGAVTTRLVLIEQQPCDTALCPGTVSSGASVELREKTSLTQTDGGLQWQFVGALNCMNVTTGAVQAVDAFEFTQSAVLRVVESADLDGTLTANTLEGTMTFTDSLTVEAFESGCRRDPATTTVEYAITAVRAPADVPTAEQ